MTHIVRSTTLSYVNIPLKKRPSRMYSRMRDDWARFRDGLKVLHGRGFVFGNQMCFLIPFWSFKNRGLDFDEKREQKEKGGACINPHYPGGALLFLSLF